MNKRAVPLILCIDDDGDTLSLLQYLLKHGEYEVMTACDGPRGIQLATANKPDVILLDVEMPGLNGYQVCLQLQKNPITSYIPVVFVTAHKTEQDREKAFAAGAADFLTKPFHLKPLLEKIQRQLERNAKWQLLKEPRNTPASPSSSFMKFKKTISRKLGFSPDKNFRWLQISSLQMYDKAFDFGIAHNELAQLIAEFMNVPYVSHIGSQIIRIGVMPTAFSKAHHIVAVDPAGCGVNFILSNPFNMMLLDAIKKCGGADTAVRFAVTEPANIARLFDRSPRERAAGAKQAPLPAREATALSAQSLKLADDICPQDTGSHGLVPPDAHEHAVGPAKPLKAPPLESPASRLSAARESRSAPPSILVVDDDETAQLLEQHFLVSEGYQVTLASDGIDALLALGQQHFDLIISDINMPHLDGYKLLEMLSEKGLHAPLILVTGSTGPEAEIKGMELGAEDYIRKPLNKEILLFKVRRALGEQQRRLGAA